MRTITISEKAYEELVIYAYNNSIDVSHAARKAFALIKLVNSLNKENKTLAIVEKDSCTVTHKITNI